MYGKKVTESENVFNTKESVTGDKVLCVLRKHG